MRHTRPDNTQDNKLQREYSALAADYDERNSVDDPYRQIPGQAILAQNGNVEILVREHVFPPGWNAPTHFHDGDLFNYVVSGQFKVITDAGGRAVNESGEAMQMTADTVMDARNLSDDKPLKLIVFQIGDPGAPFLVPVD